MSEDPRRHQWERPWEFAFCVTSAAIGFSNIAVFPHMVYENGGLVFVFVYALLVATVGIPLVYLETFLGQFPGCSMPDAFGGFPMAKGVGWTMVYTSVLISIYRTPLLFYNLVYLAASVSSELPWESCLTSIERGAATGPPTGNISTVAGSTGTGPADECYELGDGRLYPCVRVNATLARRYSLANYTGKKSVAVQSPDGGPVVAVPSAEYASMHNHCIAGSLSSQEYYFEKKVLNLSPNVFDLGTLQPGLLASEAVCWFLIFFAIWSGPRSLGKISTTIVCAAFALLSVMCADAMVLSGSQRGLLTCLKPDLWKLLQIQTWHVASSQLFYSMSLSLGSVTCFASYNDFQANIFRNSVAANLADFSFSLLGIVLVFGLYGHVAESAGLDVADVVTTRSLDYGFVGYLEGTRRLQYRSIRSAGFYFTLFALNFGSHICVIEGYLGSLRDSYPALQRHMQLAALVCCVCCFLLGIPLTFQGGYYLLGLIEGTVGENVLPWVGLVQLLTVVYAYGRDRLLSDISFMLDKPVPRYLPICWRYICPIVLLIIGFYSLTASTGGQSLKTQSLLDWTGVFQLCVLGVVLVLIGAFIFSVLGKNKYDLYAAMEPENTYGPRGHAEFMHYQMTLVKRNALPSSVSPSVRRDITSMAVLSHSNIIKTKYASSDSGTSPRDKPKIVVITGPGSVEGSGNTVFREAVASGSNDGTTAEGTPPPLAVPRHSANDVMDVRKMEAGCPVN
ncbi:sodium- and chloride-dependent glycine transporter 1-like isoform X1 [Haemaphysalis longicornis]